MEWTVSNAAINENSDFGTLVGVLSAEDVGEINSFTYALMAGDGTNDAGNEAFYLSNDSLYVHDSLDYEVQSQHSIYVKVTDSRGGVYRESLTIAVNDVNEASTDMLFEVAQLQGGAAIGFLVGVFSTVYEDAGDVFNYSMVVSSDTFAIVQDSFITIAAFDVTSRERYTVQVISTDPGGLSITKSFEVEVSDLTEEPLKPPSLHDGKHQISVYPNPFSEELTLEYQSADLYAVCNL